MRVSRAVLNNIGVFPILDHYYEPLFRTSSLVKSLREDRSLPGIDFNNEEQLHILSRFQFNGELLAFPMEKKEEAEYAYNFGPFLSGDAEYLYSLIRLYKPRRIIEVGAGQSTLMARNALKKNIDLDSSYDCEHVCIEPYECDWLEDAGVTVVRQPVENVERSLFTLLEEHDILFIDSSHIIRPQGDVLTICLEILPTLHTGVLVHIHDIFTPKDYLDEWIKDDVKLWNEQYLVEAFLSFNSQFRIIGALNYLKHHYPKEICAKCPVLQRQFSTREPGSLWLQRT